MTTPVAFDHLARLCDHRGLYEHAKMTVRREEHGYCTDDNARLLVVATREAVAGNPSPVAERLIGVALDFVLDAQVEDGRCHNRMARSGAWADEPSTEDCWGRSLWGLGTSAAQDRSPSTRARALAAFECGIQQRSEWPRAMAFAAIGAAEVCAVQPDHAGARTLLRDALDVIGDLVPCTGDAHVWAWPELRLRYANAALAEAVIVAGTVLGSDRDRDRGLTMLRWLLELETRSGHLSLTGVDGRGPEDPGVQFDQQPIEAAALADACWAATASTGERSWERGVELAAAWFEGSNDVGVVMHDRTSGGGFDGLHPTGANLNEGAESTLAFISTMQRSRSIGFALR
ncbi:MAG: hypothetical protein JWM34_35 [Ilumatobacteraceae bacterium]|nr:hypothetical protein [Ilumatobacteraceae bacterium]